MIRLLCFAFKLFVGLWMSVWGCFAEGSSEPDDSTTSMEQVEFETNFLNAIAGDQPGEYFVLANWSQVPVEPEEIYGCIVSVILKLGIRVNVAAYQTQAILAKLETFNPIPNKRN